MALVLDTGVILAALRQDDARHAECAELVAECIEPLIVPAPVLVELDYFLWKHGASDVWLTFCEDAANGSYSIHQLTPDGVLRAAQLQERYASLTLGYVDAAVFVTCELLGEAKVATLDHRDFGVLRTADGHSLDLLPVIPAR